MRNFARSLLAGAMLLAATSAFAQKSYVREDLTSDVIRLEEQLRKDTATVFATRNAEDWKRDATQALQRSSPRNALRPASAAVTAAPRDPAAWLLYARAAFGTAQLGNNDSYIMYELASAAAFTSYNRATARNDEAAALSFLGEIYSRRSMWRLALNAYKASLERVDNVTLRRTYENLRAEYGFRLLDYKVDSDSASPRVCYQFSEPLQRGKVDFAPFVAVSGAANAAITAEDQQLCVEGLKHGERYAIVVRAGLPSSVGENLLKSADYEVYVRDRSPQVRFTGKNYVLPRVGQEGVPVVSVNTDKIAVDVLRIGDRNLVPTVRSEDFLSQMGTYRLREFITEKGVKVWSGVLDVKSELNKDVTTAFPVLDAVKTLEPGVYVMAAKSGEKPISAGIDNNDDDYYGNNATQWFVVSDLGLTAFSGDDGVHVLVRSLASAAPLSNIEVRLIARNNEVLATRTTDAAGHVKFDPGLSRGTAGMAPGLVVANNKSEDYNFLDVAQTPFDLTDRGVKGRTTAKALDAFVYAERGVYRSGETVNLTAQLRDARGASVSSLPLTLVVKRPDGVDYKRALVEDQGLGGRAWSVNLLPNVATGTWRVLAYADPKSPSVGETSFLVEDYIPERLDFTIKAVEEAARSGESITIQADARYLYGAPGSNLDITGDVTIRTTDEDVLPGLSGYSIGLEDEAFESVKNELEEPATTDASGKATLTVQIPEFTAPRPVEAHIVLRVGEPGGRAVERTLTIPVRPNSGVIAVKKNFDELSDGATATFDVAAINSNGQRGARKNVQWTLYRVSTNYQWYNSDGRWGYERIKSTRRIADGRIDIDTVQPAKISAAVGWGAHRLELRSDDGNDQPTAITFDVGWSGDSTAETPDLLEVSLDKQGYRAGETMKLRIASRFDGKASVAIIGDKLSELVVQDVKTGDNEVSVPVKADWGAGAYAVAIAHRPLDQAARRMPGRALGLAWFGIDQDARKLTVSIDTPDKIEPRRPFSIPVKLAGLAPGEEAYVTVAAVDIGILNLTGYETPDPSEFFFGQRQLSTEIRDLYGLLIDGMQGSRGAIRSGGDAAAAGLEGNRPTQEPLSRYSGVVKVAADGTAQVTFEIPAFNGSVRVMAEAWSKTRVGHAQKDVIIRDPVVVQATLPRFLSLGDQSRFHMQIDNVEGQAGDYVVDLDVRGPVTIPVDALRRSFRLNANGRTAVTVPVTAAGVGTAVVDLKLTGPNITATQSFALNVKPGTTDLYRRTVRSIAPGTNVTLSGDLVADFLPNTGAVSVAVSPLGSIDVAGLLQALDRYPYGCSEQIVSRAMPLLYVNRLASTEALALDGALDQRVRDAIERVLTRQDSSGAFGLWSAGSADDLWLDAFVTDFLTRARENKFEVPQRSFEQALDRLRNQVANTTDVKPGSGEAIAYAIYVLARNGRPVMGDLRYLADTKINSFTTALSRAQIAAALALLGDRGRAQAVFASANDLLGSFRQGRFSRSDYGSKLRDAAGFLALAAESGIDRAQIIRASETLSSERNTSTYTSTQENAWMVLAAEAMSRDAQSLALTVDGAAHQGGLFRTWRNYNTDSRNISIGNAGNAVAQLVLTTSGNPVVPEPAAQQGYQVERTLYKLDGKQVDPATIKQNDRMVVVLKVTELEAAYARLLLVDKLPAGLEIDNPNMFDGGSIDGLSWLKRDVEPATAEYRDDRFVAAFDRAGRDKATFSVAYIVRAVTPGRYVHPPAAIEDMYRPERFGRTAFGTVEISEAR
jgi:uncharacterized protein YfaS (alpha-2-macroglobulin family)